LSAELRSGTPWWLDRNPRRTEFPPLTEDLRCDVAILGAGVSGALVALELARRGVSVGVVDGGDVGRGSTAASTALLLVETDADFRELVDRFGAARATRVWKLGEHALDALEKFSHEAPFDLEFERKVVLRLASDRQGRRALEVEAVARRAAGFEVELVEGGRRGELGSLPHAIALRSRGAAIDPYRLTVAALEAAAARGATIRDRTFVRRIECSRDGVVLRSDRGPRVFAGRLVVAAGYASEKLLGLDLGRLRTTYALVTEPLGTPVPGWPDGALVWDTSDPYLYGRPLPDGRVLFGGLDTPFAGDHRSRARLERRARKLEVTLARWLPGAEVETTAAWAGTFGESRDALPWIGPVPGDRRTFAALGFGGNGITFSAIAAELLADVLTRGESTDLELFAFDR
jgi:glycine/D-amino acid oxidase-like deaminating enzyme